MVRSGSKRVHVLTLVVVSSVCALCSYPSMNSAEGVLKKAPRSDSSAAFDARANDGTSLPCAATNLNLIDRGTDVGAGSWIQLFQITNRGDESCALRGYPSISLAQTGGAFHSLLVISIKYEAGRKIGDSRNGHCLLRFFPLAVACRRSGLPPAIRPPLISLDASWRQAFS